MNADTGVFERQMKGTKRMYLNIGVSRAKTGNEELYVGSAANEADRAEQVIVASS